MKHIVVFSKGIEEDQAPIVRELIEKCQSAGIRISFMKEVYDSVRRWMDLPTSMTGIGASDLTGLKDIDFLFSLGGDGTLLEASMLTNDIPIVGINMGRLGFLSSIEKKYVSQTIDRLNSGDYTLEYRSLLHFQSNEGQFESYPYALNDMTIIKRDHSSMIVIHATLNGEFLNSYWADGIIVSTPTGSTGYNLSCGGPILLPTAEDFIITPIAPHNLSVRPIVVPDIAQLEFTIEGRAENFLCTLDSRYEVISPDCKITIRKAPHTIPLVRLPKITFTKTIRDKLQWGRDLRNYKPR
ncbi:MAG TPA: NAD kinase [Saprospiraceae bacterium]|nr:MAG: inorganic polyphosphate/ATP-NAD kinase [Candidatus Parvibacillus calidus]MCC7148576.1 NAD kinase [Saprospiraceae bacterium]WKZ62659.1 MAG: NAD kinase [Saprospiraceae bacterium]HQN56805.1 NAD kinase [Saprospiraceae bacterium]HRN33578.1 NAD kinase [Saprospiraceae bacterium]